MASAGTLQRCRDEAPEALLDELSSAIVDELSVAGVLPESASYSRCRLAVAHAGAAACVSTRDIAGARLWDWLLAALNRPTALADCERVLGFGTLLTEWMFPSRWIDTAAQRDVADAGALANFIVTVFDHLADESAPRSQPMSPRMLRRVCAGDLAPVALIGLVGPPPARLLARLVREYFRRVNRLPFGSRHRDLRALLTRTIVAMHAAEVETLTAARVSDRAIRRKSALPFVTMAMAAWLAAAETPAPVLRAHLRWSYRLGELLGEIDDAADARDDIAAGRPNRLVAELSTPGGARPDALASALARRALRVVEDRHRFIDPDAARDGADDILGVLIASWLGVRAVRSINS